MGQSALLTLRLDRKLKRQLDKLAYATHRSRSYLAAAAIREYVALNAWQVGAIERAVAEADRGEFASEQEVRRTIKKWTRRAG